MKIISYSGTEGESIVIEKPQDLYPLLDWFHTKIMDLGASDDDLHKVSRVMDTAEEFGLGNFDDIDEIKFS